MTTPAEHRELERELLATIDALRSDLQRVTSALTEIVDHGSCYEVTAPALTECDIYVFPATCSTEALEEDRIWCAPCLANIAREALRHA